MQKHGAPLYNPILKELDKDHSWEQFLAGYVDHFKPEGVPESSAVERCAYLDWELRAIARYKKSLSQLGLTEAHTKEAVKASTAEAHSKSAKELLAADPAADVSPWSAAKIMSTAAEIIGLDLREHPIGLVSGSDVPRFLSEEEEEQEGIVWDSGNLASAIQMFALRGGLEPDEMFEALTARLDDEAADKVRWMHRRMTLAAIPNFPIEGLTIQQLDAHEKHLSEQFEGALKYLCVLRNDRAIRRKPLSPAEDSNNSFQLIRKGNRRALGKAL